jgi:predicted nucleotidyltransferase
VDQDLGSLRDHDGSGWTVLTEADAESATGDDVLADAVRAGRESLGGRLLAAYALGSLAHGGFSPLVSDVDVALILADWHRPAALSWPRRSASGGPDSSADLQDRHAVDTSETERFS